MLIKWSDIMLTAWTDDPNDLVDIIYIFREEAYKEIKEILNMI